MHNKTANSKNDKLIHTVLIVEDEEVNYLYLEALLEDASSFSIKLIHAKNGKEYGCHISLEAPEALETWDR